MHEVDPDVKSLERANTECNCKHRRCLRLYTGQRSALPLHVAGHRSQTDALWLPDGSQGAIFQLEEARRECWSTPRCLKEGVECLASSCRIAIRHIRGERGLRIDDQVRRSEQHISFRGNVRTNGPTGSQRTATLRRSRCSEASQLVHLAGMVHMSSVRVSQISSLTHASETLIRGISSRIDENYVEAVGEGKE